MYRPGCKRQAGVDQIAFGLQFPVMMRNVGQYRMQDRIQDETLNPRVTAKIDQGTRDHILFRMHRRANVKHLACALHRALERVVIG
jgi:hypothetical protein